MEWVKSIKTEGQPIRCMTLLPTGNIACGLADGKIHIYNSEMLALVAVMSYDAGNRNPIKHMQGVKPDKLVTCQENSSKIDLWDLVRLTKFHSFENSDKIKALCALPDGRFVVSDEDQDISIFRFAEDGLDRKHLERRDRHWNTLSFAVLDDRKFASAAMHGAISVWDFVSMEHLFDIDTGTFFLMNMCSMPNGYLLSGHDYGRIKIWDIETKQMLYEFQVEGGGLSSLSHVSGEIAATTTDGDKTMAINIRTKKMVRVMEEYDLNVKQDIVALPNKMVAVSCSNKIRLFKINNTL